MKFNLGLSALGVAMLALSGCATQNMKVIESSVQDTQVSGQKLAEQMRAVPPKNPFFSKQDTFWVERTPLPAALDPTSQLPPIFKAETVFNEQTAVPLTEVLARLNKTHGVMFTVSQDVYEADSRVGMNLSAPAQADATSARPGAPVPLAASAGAGANNSAAGGSGGRVDVIVSDLIYKGTLAGLLDMMATKTNLAWKFDGERVHFFRYETKVFRIDALAGKATSSAKVGSGASGGASAGGAGGGTVSTSQETSMDTFADIWADVSTSVQAMLSGRGKMSMLPSTGQVTVTDTPDQLRKIDSYVKELNKDLGKQIAFNVDVYSVEVQNNNNFGVDWSLLWGKLSSQYGIGYSNAGNTVNSNRFFSVDVLNGPLTGSKVMFGALSSIGKTSLVTSTSLMTLNYIPVPVAVTQETAYLQRQSTTVSGTSGTSQTSLEPGTVTTGFSMNLTPRASTTDKLQLQFSMDLSDLTNIATFTSPDGNSSIQLPQRNVRNFLQRVSMRSGQSLILSGFQQTRANSGKDGLVKPENWALGGKAETNGVSTTLVVVITPYVMH